MSVRDSGKGVDPGDMPTVFDPFFVTQPTGMGLATVRSIIEDLGRAGWGGAES
jgi:signal transduction histidine kinase